MSQSTVKMRSAWIFVFLALALIIVACVAEAPIMAAAVLLSMAIGPVTVVWTARLWRRRGRGQRTWLDHSALASAVVWGFAILGLLAVATSRARTRAMLYVTTCDLQMIARSHLSYREAFESYPDTLRTLARCDYISTYQLMSARDPHWWSPTPDEYSSFEYQPMQASWPLLPDLILCHERQPWSMTSARIFPDYGRFVLFADGSVRRLTDDEFAEAVTLDRLRREELAENAD